MFRGEALFGFCRIIDDILFVGEVRVDIDQLRFKFSDFGFCAGFVLLQRVFCRVQTGQQSGGNQLFFALRLQQSGQFIRKAHGFRRVQLRIGNSGFPLAQISLRRFQSIQRALPAFQPKQGLIFVDFSGETFVAGGLAGLTAQRQKLALNLPDDIFQAVQVIFSGAQAKFRFMAAGMQPGNAGGFFEDTAAIARLGRDEF